MYTASSRSTCVQALVAALVFAPGPSRAQSQLPDECPASTPTFRVGHAIRSLDVSGALDPLTLAIDETRPVQVHLWYPAREQDDCGDPADLGPGPGGCHAPPAVYTSRLNGLYGDFLSPLQWLPLSWTIPAAAAYENAQLADADQPFPVIVFSHGNQNDAIDYAYTLERLASHGFIVVAPDHLNNTQEEVRIDFSNDALQDAHQGQRIPCLDNAAPDPVVVNGVPRLHCSRPSVSKSMVDRYRDVEAVLNALPAWFGHRADMDRVGIMGHSRGTVTSLAVAGGSAAWGSAEGVPFKPDPRIKAVMGLSIGMQTVTSPVDVQNVTVPVLLVGGGLDATGPLAVSNWAIANLTKLGPADKQLVVIQNAYHRHFDSAYCAEMQSSGGIALDPRAALDRQTAAQILYHPTSGLATDYCALDSFETPADIRVLAQTIVAQHIPGFSFPSSVPTSGLTTDTVEEQVVGLAVSFFGSVLDRADGASHPFADCLPEKFGSQPTVPQPTQQELNAPAPDADDPD